MKITSEKNTLDIRDYGSADSDGLGTSVQATDNLPRNDYQKVESSQVFKLIHSCILVICLTPD